MSRHDAVGGPFTVRRLFEDPALTGATPSQLKVAPGGRHVAFLRPEEENRERLSLWCHDIGEGRLERLVVAPADAAEPTAAERAERERRRRFAGGVTAYAWHPDGERVLATIDGAAWLCDIGSGVATALTPPREQQQGITLSRTGRFVSFTRDGELHVRDVATGVVQRLTDDASETVTNGLPEFIAQEEMHRFTGHWWAKDDRHLAFTRVDTAAIAETQRFETHGEGVDVISQRYPHAGGTNAEVRLVLLELDADGAPAARGELDWREGGFEYLARVAFAPSGALIAQVQSRDQRRLAVKRWAPDGQKWTTLFEEAHSAWINLHDNLTFTGAGDAFVWTSERDGHTDLYLHNGVDGELRRWPSGLGGVRRVLWADADTALVAGWLADPTAQHLYCVARDGGPPAALTEGTAWHDGAVDAAGKVCVVATTSPDTPSRLDAIDLASGQRTHVCGGAVAPGHPYHPFRAHHVPAQFGSLAAEDGQRLHYRLTPPAGLEAGGRHPVIVHVYGGPGVQRVRREWGPLTLQLFAQRGYGVFELDNRGSAGRAKRFEDPLHGRLGDVEVRDQLASAAFLRRLDWVDGDRIGVFGHSYGGYMALLMMAQAPDVFTAGVSVAPVTDWALYDTHYVERYLGRPDDNPEGYRQSAVFPWLDGLHGPLLLMHGMADDNVLFAHSTRLMQALQERGVLFELMTYPGAKHALHERHVAIHRHETILDFFKRRL